MFTSPSFICPPAQNLHRQRKTAVLLAILTLVTALSSCRRNAAPADEIPPGQARSSTCAQREQAALIALYNATGGPDWHDNSNWLSPKPFSTWFGVTTASNGCVTRLDLQNNNLTGSIPPELGSLPMLQSLDLQNNNLGGPIPPELANASNLERLFLAPNNFTGCIPRQLVRLDENLPRLLVDRIRRELLFTPLPDRSDLGDVDLYYCVENPGLPINSALSAPSNLSYAYQGSTIVISWDPVDGADRYNLYHDDAIDSSCRLSPSGRPGRCDYLATVLAETTYTHADPAAGRNYYWVIACNSSGCSPLDAQNAASPPADTPYRPGLDYPPAPSNLTYAFEGSSLVINWDPADDADYYNLYHHDFASTYCHVRPDGSSSICDQLAANLVETTYTHAATDRSNYYWVAACNNVGCSPVAEESPAKPAVDIPPPPPTSPTLSKAPPSSSPGTRLTAAPTTTTFTITAPLPPPVKCARTARPSYATNWPPTSSRPPTRTPTPTPTEATTTGSSPATGEDARPSTSQMSLARSKPAPQTATTELIDVTVRFRPLPLPQSPRQP